MKFLIHFVRKHSNHRSLILMKYSFCMLCKPLARILIIKCFNVHIINSIYTQNALYFHDIKVCCFSHRKVLCLKIFDFLWFLNLSPKLLYIESCSLFLTLCPFSVYSFHWRFKSFSWFQWKSLICNISNYPSVAMTSV